MSVANQGLHHVGMTVRNLERSLRWYGEMFGVEAQVLADASGPQLCAAVRLAEARLDYAIVPLGGCRLELLEYRNPMGIDFDLRNCDVGVAHICVQVDDVDAAYAEMGAKGAAFNAPPFQVSGGPMEGHKICFLRDPDGILIELIQGPETPSRWTPQESTARSG